MDNEKKCICLAVVQQIDRTCAAGHRVKSFYTRKAFKDFLASNPGRIHNDEALVILQGGAGQIATLAAACSMPWMLETT